MSLRWRLMLVIATLVAAAVGLAAFGAHAIAERELRAGVDEFLEDRAQTAAPLILDAFIRGNGDSNGNGGDRRPGPDRNDLRRFDAAIQVIGPNGQAFADFSVDGEVTLPIEDVDLDVIALQSRLYRTISIDGTKYRMLTIGTNNGGLQVARDLSEVEKSLAGIDRWLVGVGILGTVLGAAIGWAVASGVLRPIRRLSAAAHTVAETQDFSTPIDVRRSDEIGRLAESFNRMLAALGDSKEQQQRLVRDASHELRTPLTSVRTNIDLLARADNLPDEVRGEIIADVQSEMNELTTLVTELVDLAGEQEAREPIVDIDLEMLVRPIAERAARRTNRTVAVTVEAPGVVQGAEAKIERAVSNLIGNALKFSPEDTAVGVAVQGNRITVADRGPGVDDADKPRIFDRFYRAVGTRTMPGSGLGLAIVAQVAAEHGGTVEVSDTPGGGATFTLEIPAGF